MSSSLEQALASARGRHWEQTLAHLLAAFRASPTAQIAALVARVSELAETGLPAIAGKNLDARKDATIALLEGGDPKQLPRVLRLLRELRIAQAKELVEALGKVPPDPRFLDAALPLLRDPPFSSSTSMPFWRAFLALVDAQGDPRTRPALAALDFSWLPEWSAEQLRLACARLGVQKGKRGRSSVDAVPQALSPADAATCAAIEAALGATQADGTALLAAIHDRPEDDGPRAVWADWLEERGDPRGRFITLQLAAAQRALTDDERKATRTLLEQHGDEWLGDLAGVVELADVYFTRGLVGAVRAGTDELARLVASEHAPTIEWLWLHLRDAFDAALLRDARFRALRFLGGITPPVLDAVIAHGPYPFRGLGLDLYDALPGREESWTEEQRATLERVYGLRATFPALDTLAVRAWYKQPDTLDELWRSPLCQGIRRLHLSGAGGAASWFGRRHLLPPNLELLEVSFDFGFHDWTTALHRDEDGELSRVVATLRPKRRDFAGGKLEEFAADFLDEMPPDVLTDIEVHVDGARATKPAVDAIVEAARRHTRLRRLAVPGRTPTVPQPSSTPVRTAKQVAAEAFAAQAKLALDRFAAVVGVHLDGVDATTADAMAQLARALPGDARAAEAALAALAVPYPPDPGAAYRSARHELTVRALTAYVQTAPEQPFAGLVPVLANISAHALAVVLGDHHALVGRDEVPAFLDWFETLPVSGGASNLYYTVRDVLAHHGSEALRAEVKKRLSSHKLNRFHKWAYEEYAKS